SGWDHANTLAALRLADSSAALDQFDFAVREQLPGSGLERLRELTRDARALRLLDELAALDPWRSAVLTASQWAGRLKSCAGESPAPPAFDAAIDETAQFLGESRRVSLEEFWSAAEAALRMSPLRIADRRRNVVHVLSVFEAR